ncbi:MAG TPA: hypothetical protein VHV30_14340 [Polyangiaceae bacterium]|jgi:hypothetical protein|nr:hypothetical protein [Polyangiaceae bacterium]
MDSSLSSFPPSTSSVRADVVGVPTTARPTEAPVRVHFADVLAGGAQALVAGAQAAVSALPGNPLTAVAIRGSTPGALGASPELGGVHTASSLSVGTSPEGPGGASASTGLANIGGVSLGLGGTSTSGTGTAGTSTDPNLEATMAQSQEMNLYYLQVQEQVNAQNRTFTALTNVLEVEHSTAKSAISNIH